MTGVDPLLTLADAARQYAFAYNAEKAAYTTFLACPDDDTKAAWLRAQRRTGNRCDDLRAAALRANGVEADPGLFGADL